MALLESLLIILSYLSDSWQHFKIDFSFSFWSKYFTSGQNDQNWSNWSKWSKLSVPQGSVLQLLPFNICLGHV